MAVLTNFAWAVLESIVTKHERLGLPIESRKVNPEVKAELLAIKAVEERAPGSRYRSHSQPSALYPTELGKNLLADRKAIQQSKAESP